MTEKVAPSNPITAQFASADEFSQYIEIQAITKGATIMEVLLEFCDEFDVDDIIVAKYVSRSLKEKIAEEYGGMNLMGGNEGVLPI